MSDWDGITINTSRVLRIHTDIAGRHYYWNVQFGTHRPKALSRTTGNLLFRCTRYLGALGTPDSLILPQRHASACLHAMIMLLDTFERKHLSYEGQADPELCVRNVIQNTAMLYAVDPDTMMSTYSSIRPYLSQGAYEPPISIDAMIDAKRSQHVNIKD